jgi:hypothetical protein
MKYKPNQIIFSRDNKKIYIRGVVDGRIVYKIFDSKTQKYIYHVKSEKQFNLFFH